MTISGAAACSKCSSPPSFCADITFHRIPPPADFFDASWSTLSGRVHNAFCVNDMSTYLYMSNSRPSHTSASPNPQIPQLQICHYSCQIPLFAPVLIIVTHSFTIFCPMWHRLHYITKGGTTNLKVGGQCIGRRGGVNTVKILTFEKGWSAWTRLPSSYGGAAPVTLPLPSRRTFHWLPILKPHIIGIYN